MKFSQQLVFFTTLSSTSHTASAYRPAVILVPSAFHPASVYEETVRGLSQSGYENISSISLPSFASLATRRDDVDVVIKVTKTYLDEGKDIVLVGNSYGCTVIGEAVHNLPRYPLASSTFADDTSLSSGRILGLIYFAGYIPFIADVNSSEALDIRQVSPSWFSFSPDTPDGIPQTVGWDGDMESFPPQKTMYNLLEAGKADLWTSKLRRTSFAALNATAEYVPYAGDFRVVYVAGTQDYAVSEALWEAYINQPGANFVMETLDADHVPMLSRPSKVVELIRKYSESTDAW